MKLQQMLNKKTVAIVLIALLLGSCNSNSRDSKSNDATNESDSTALSSTTSQEESLVSENKAESLVKSKDQSKLNESQLSVQRLLASCVAGNYDEAAKFILYRGADQSRVGLDFFNNANAQEANTVKVTCDVIVSWLGTSQSYEFISYQEEESEYGLLYVIEVMFKKEKLGVERHFFHLMDTPKGKLLVNMI